MPLGEYTVAEPASPLGGILLSYLLPFLLIGVFWYFIYRRMSGAARGGGRAGSSGSARARRPR